MTRPHDHDAARLPVEGSSPCDAFAVAAVLRGDRELGRAETAALEAHLARCETCRARAREAEGVSRVLKSWDAERASHVRAPARLRQEVLPALAEEGRRRRRETRLVRVLHLATAASVVLALAAGVFFGLRFEEGVVRPPGGSSIVAQVPEPSTAASAVVEPPLPVPTAWEPRPLPPSPLRALGEASGNATVDWMSRRELWEVRDALFCYMLEPDQRDFYREYGETGEWWRTVEGEDRLITLGALASIQAHGAGSVEGFVQGLLARTGTAPLPGHDYGDPVKVIDTGLRVTDVVPLPREHGQLDAWLGGSALPMNLASGLCAQPLIRPRDVERKEIAKYVFDLSRAVASDLVTLKEGTDDDLVAFVRGARFPIFIPRGELIAGGRVDRVVASDIWIPARTEPHRHQIPCAAISNERGSSGDLPRPIGQLAGPQLRRLLARGGGHNAVLALVHEQIVPRSLDFTLLAAYDVPSRADVLKTWAGVLRLSSVEGMVVMGGNGAFEGLEVSGLPIEPASELMARLLLGYAIEWTLPGRAQHRKEHAGDHALVALEQLLGYEGTFKAVGAGAGKNGDALRLARLLDTYSGIEFAIFEHAATGGVVLGSALPK